MAQEIINNPREELKQKRRNAFFVLHSLMISPSIFTEEIDKKLDDFFESGIELREREKHLGK